VELFHVHPLCLARAVKARWALAATALLIALRFAVAGFLPLSADEAYYWLWSQHLAAGYFDHPPGIAFVIRFGTLLFGDTPFGVRFGGILLLLPATYLVWRSARILTDDDLIAARACLFFNLTLMIAAETMAATPDAPSIPTSAAFLFCLVKLRQTEKGRWWLAAGVAAGLGLLAKYTAFFLGAGALAWLLLDRDARRWLLTPWPYLGGALAGLIFAPNLLWNADHGWMTFAFQFGRIGTGHLTARYLVEFLGAQLGLASPLILLLAGIGLVRARRGEGLFLLAALIWPSLLYFLFHALRDRVQGNWPCYLYPALAILAAETAARAQNKFVRLSALCATPLAALMLALVYAQALFGILPLGRGDPLTRLLGGGIPAVAQQLQALQASSGASAILTSDYETTAWLRFYSPLRVIQANESFRYPDATLPSQALLNGPLLYLAEQRVDQSKKLAGHFAALKPLGEIDRKRGDLIIARYNVYRADGLRGAPFGKMP
jgi:4-amino-4-deoxy-L-arabinose transferase-like glycosyltransferase